MDGQDWQPHGCDTQSMASVQRHWWQVMTGELPEQRKSRRGLLLTSALGVLEGLPAASTEKDTLFSCGPRLPCPGAAVLCALCCALGASLRLALGS